MSDARSALLHIWADFTQIDLTAGDKGSRGTPEIRLREADAAAKVMRLKWRGNMRFPDARLENHVAARMSLAGQIRRLRPSPMKRLR